MTCERKFSGKMIITNFINQTEDRVLDFSLNRLKIQGYCEMRHILKGGK